MDTLFRLVSLQDQQQSSFNPTSNSKSSKSHHPNYLLHLSQHQPEECCNNNPFMDEDFSSSSSSSKHFLPSPHHPPTTTTTHALDFSFSPHINLTNNPATSSSNWASELLLACARAIVSQDNPRVQQLMWMLNELSSPYGDTDQKLASYFLHALFSRLTSSGPRTLLTLSSASDRTCSFDSTRRTALRFQELSPWSSFGHVAANGAILDSFLSSSSTAHHRLHILDLSTTFCTQWPTLLEALATRSSSDETPHLSITTVLSSSAAAQKVMKEIAARMEKFARLMGVPFHFHAVHHSGDLSDLDLSSLLPNDNSEALAVNIVNSLHGVSPSVHRRDALLSAIRRLQPRIVTVVEEEADLLDGGDEDEAFLRGVKESIRFFAAYFDSIEESFPPTSNERLALERSAGRAIVDLVACPAAESGERRETAAGWSRRMKAAGFSPAAFSEDVVDDVRSLLKRYREGWSMREAAEESEDSGSAADGGGGGIFLAWKEQPVVWASAWKT